jgi:imidazolonepropionase-like amidohydrolase
MTRRTIITLALALLSWLPLTGFGLGDEEEAGKETYTALVGGWLIDGTGLVPIDDAVVLIANNKIKAVGRANRVKIPAGATIIEVRGKYILPGLIDAHNHLEGLGLNEEDAEFSDTPEKLRQVILNNAQLDFYSGVTTVRDCGSSEMVLKLREQIEANGPRLLAAGPQFVKKDPTQPSLPLFLEYDDVKEAKKKIHEQIAKGADLIKVRITRQRPMPTIEEMTAIVHEAHRAGLRVAVHTDVPHEDAIRLAVAAGADTIEHNAVLRAYDDRILLDMARKNIILVPTLFPIQAQRVDPLEKTDDELIEQPLQSRLQPEVLQALYKRAALWRKNLVEWRSRGYDAKRTLKETALVVARVRSLGVKIALGPDTGSDLVPHGRLYKEMVLYVNQGIPPMEVIQMATKLGAEALGKEKELGTIEPGKLADLIVIDGDPLLDIEAIRNVVMVIKNGKPVELPKAEAKTY